MRRAAWHLHLEAYALGLVFIFVDQLGPELGADFFLGVGIPLGMICHDVMNALGLAIAGYLGVAVFNGLLEVGLGGHVFQSLSCTYGMYLAFPEKLVRACHYDAKYQRMWIVCGSDHAVVSEY